MYSERISPMKLSKRQTWIGLSALILVLIAGGIGYYQFIYLSKQTTSAQSELQTSVARRGDLVIYASGSGTLVAAEEYDLGFKTGGQVTAVFVKPGDQVKAGDLLAQVDDSNAQSQFTPVKRKYQELTSDAGIASALQAVSDAEKKLRSAQLQLEYLISPKVMYWESEIEKAEEAVQKAQEAVNTSPADGTLQKALKDKQAYLGFAEYQLQLAHEYFADVYRYQYFVARDKNGEYYFALPTDQEIFSARADIVEAQKDLQEGKYLYATLTGQDIPAEANSDALQELQQAKLDLEAAQAALDGTLIVAPISGTVMSVDTSVGNTTGSSTVIIVADLSRVYLEVYLDASDWDKVAVGKQAEVTFDALPDKVFTGKVAQIDATLYSSGNTTAIKGIVSLDSPFAELNLPLGVAASVDVISAQARDAVLVPVEALHETSPGKYAVFVMENGKLRLRVVEVGIQDLVSAEIIAGLQPGEIVSTGITQTK
jgi:HlyD family secretion protein